MPVDLLGLILFLTAVSPGYVYLRIAEARKPRPTRPTLVQTVEIFLIGSVFTGLAGVGVSAFMQDQFGLLDGWISDSGQYWKEHYNLVATWVTCVIVVAHGAAAGTARFIYRNVPPGYSPGGSVWTQMLARDHDETLVFVSAHLADANVVSGYVSGFDLDAERSQRDLALQAPIYLTLPGHAPARQPAIERLIVSADMIDQIGVRYESAAEILRD